MTEHLLHMVNRPAGLKPTAPGLVSEIVKMQINAPERD